jgi:3-oxoadipate enol-lactonase
MNTLELAYRTPEDFDPKGRVVFLGSSLGSASLMWARALPFLAPDMQAVTWDLPGHGDSAPTESNFSLADVADSLVALADKLGVDTFDYAGVSISGAIALELALHHPKRVRSIAVMFSAAKLGTPESWADRAALVRASGTSTLVPDMPPRWFSPEFVQEDPMWLDTMLDVLSDVDDDSYAKCCEALGGYDVRERLGDVTIPTLVIAGDHDPSISADQVRELMTGLPDAKLYIVEGGRHLAVVDFPQVTAGALNAFWSTIH